MDAAKIEVHENYVATDQSIMTLLIEMKREISALGKKISELAARLEQLPPPIPVQATMSNTYAVLRARNFHLRRGELMPFVADHS